MPSQRAFYFPQSGTAGRTLENESSTPTPVNNHAEAITTALEDCDYSYDYYTLRRRNDTSSIEQSTEDQGHLPSSRSSSNQDATLLLHTYLWLMKSAFDLEYLLLEPRYSD
jgi:hypothetical protein